MKRVVDNTHQNPELTRTCAACRRTFDVALHHCPHCGLIERVQPQHRQAVIRLWLFSLALSALLIYAMVAFKTTPDGIAAVQTLTTITVATFTSIVLVRINEAKSARYINWLRNQNPVTKETLRLFTYAVGLVMVIAAFVSQNSSAPLSILNIVLASILTWAQTSHVLSLTSSPHPVPIQPDIQ